MTIREIEALEETAGYVDPDYEMDLFDDLSREDWQREIEDAWQEYRELTFDPDEAWRDEYEAYVNL